MQFGPARLTLAVSRTRTSPKGLLFAHALRRSHSPQAPSRGNANILPHPRPPRKGRNPKNLKKLSTSFLNVA